MTRTALIGLVLLAACKIRNESSCDIPGNCVEGDGSMQACSSSTECADDGVCKLPEGICVGCIEATDCDATSDHPVCNTDSNACEGCDANADCAESGACNFATGACFASTEVAYIEANQAGNCEVSSPCGSLQEAFDTGRSVIKVVGTNQVIGTSRLMVDRDLLVMGDAPTILSSLKTNNAPTFEVVGGATLSLRDLELSRNTGVSGDGFVISGMTASATLEHVFLLDNAAHGVVATKGNKLTMRGCVISGNTLGGADLNDIGFEITNTIIATNGNGATPVGGLRTRPVDPSTVIFEFNTIANNMTVGTAAPRSGVDCSGIAFPAHNNIVAGVNNGFVLDPNCTFDNSLFTGNVPTGQNGDPSNRSTNNVMFASESSAEARLGTFFRLTENSPAVDQADSTSAVAVDIDGQRRPQGDEKDMGADELMR